MIKLAAQLVPVKVNAEKEGKDLAKKYKVQGFPTILFLDSKGTVMGQIGGYMPPDPFHDEMQKAISSHRDFPKVEATLKTKPNDGWANAKMASICAMRGDQPGAEKALKLAEAAKYRGPEMAQAYNAVGDLHQSARRFAVGIAHFEKAYAATSDAGVRSYALVSIMYCHLGNQDTASAKKAAKRLVDLKGANSEYVKMAQDVLKMPG